MVVEARDGSRNGVRVEEAMEDIDEIRGKRCCELLSPLCGHNLSTADMGATDEDVGALRNKGGVDIATTRPFRLTLFWRGGPALGGDRNQNRGLMQCFELLDDEA